MSADQRSTAASRWSAAEPASRPASRAASGAQPAVPRPGGRRPASCPRTARSRTGRPAGSPGPGAPARTPGRAAHPRSGRAVPSGRVRSADGPRPGRRRSARSSTARRARTGRSRADPSGAPSGCRRASRPGRRTCPTARTAVAEHDRARRGRSSSVQSRWPSSVSTSAVTSPSRQYPPAARARGGRSAPISGIGCAWWCSGGRWGWSRSGWPGRRRGRASWSGV